MYYTGTKTEWDGVNKGEGNDSLTNATLHYYVYKGTCGATGNEDKVTWTLDNDGTLTIGGTGNMKDYNLLGNILAPWYDARVDIQTVVIENGVTNVGAFAFYNCTSLASVTIPDSVTSIGLYAFNSCTSLESVVIPKNVTSIESGTFSGCTGLTSVTIPLSVNSMGNNAFSGCTGLTSMSIPLSVTNIGNSTFSGCTGLTSMSIPKSVTTIGSDTFNGCTNLASVIILSRNITSIGNNAFNGCSKLTAIYMPKDCSIDTSAIPDVASQINYRVEHTTKNKGIDDEKVVVITSATKSITLNCDSMGNGYYIIKNEAGDSVTLSDVCKPNDDTITHTGYSMRRRKKINAENHVYGCVAGGERRCIDCGAKQTCTGNPSEVKSGNLTYNCYTCGDGIKVVELNLAAA